MGSLPESPAPPQRHCQIGGEDAGLHCPASAMAVLDHCVLQHAPRTAGIGMHAALLRSVACRAASYAKLQGSPCIGQPQRTLQSQGSCAACLISSGEQGLQVACRCPAAVTEEGKETSWSLDSESVPRAPVCRWEYLWRRLPCTQARSSPNLWQMLERVTSQTSLIRNAFLAFA